MKRISITSSDKIYEIITLHQVPNGYFVSGFPKVIVNRNDEIKKVISTIKDCLDSSKKNFKDEDDADKNKEFIEKVVSESGYKTYNKFLENSKNVIIDQEKNRYEFLPKYYVPKKKSFFPDESKGEVMLPLNASDEEFYLTIKRLLE